MHLKYAYIFGCFILLVFWLTIFFIRKDLRKEIIWASLVGLPFGFIDYFLIPGYWHPEVVFDLGIKHGFGIESFLFFSLMAGIASVIYEFVEKKRLIKIKGDTRHHFLILIFLVTLFIILEIIFQDQSIYNLIVSLFSGGVILVFVRRDLLKHMIISGFIFTIFYFIVFIIIKEIFLDIVPSFYDLSSIWNIPFVNVPAQELFASFTGGMLWSVLYAYTNAFRED
ncbi:MAG TPA: lycopene cyclase domain-containing protein [Candidatus Paceibacterota bacterium]